jgi:AcrR family transcriptional regulator
VSTPVIKRRLAPEERRALIEDAAARLFAERGYAATRLDDIAAAADVSKPIVYRHFESKKELHLALLAKHRDELASRVAAYFVGEGTIDSRLEPMLEAWFGYVEEHPYAWRMLFRDITGDPEIEAFHRDLRARQRSADIVLLRVAMEQHQLAIAEAELEPLAEIVRSSLTGLAIWWLDHPEVPRSVLVDVMLRVISGTLAFSG